MSSSYKIKKDFNDKNLEFLTSKKSVDEVALEKERKKNRNEQKIEPIHTDSFTNTRMPPKHPTRSAMVGYKKLSFASIVD